VPGANRPHTNNWLAVFFYVDDIGEQYRRQHEGKLEKFYELTQHFEVRRIHEAIFFLGVRLFRSRQNRTCRALLCQDSYLEKLAAKFKIAEDGSRLPATPMATEEWIPYGSMRINNAPNQSTFSCASDTVFADNKDRTSEDDVGCFRET